MENAEEVFGPPWWDPTSSPSGIDLRVEAERVRACTKSGTSVLVRAQGSGDTVTTRQYGWTAGRRPSGRSSTTVHERMVASRPV
jgi:hypothetical protein